MKYLVLGVVAVAVLVSMGPAFATSERLHWEPREAQEACHAKGFPIINVEQKVRNDPDSGVKGNWALDSFVRHIVVWQTAPGKFCAVATYNGEFNSSSFAGSPSPGGTSTLTGREHGPFEGGFVANFSATFTPAATPTHGFIGSTDYADTSKAFTGGVSSWTPLYFDSGHDASIGSDLSWWGWIYHGGKCGTWIDEIKHSGVGTGEIACP